MYEELIKALRNVSEYDSGYAKLMYDAADAIERLQSQNIELLFRTSQAEALIDYYQTGRMTSNELPKEETWQMV